MPIMNELQPNPGLLKDVKILVVDNDRDSRELYAFLLKRHDAKVITIGSIKDALVLLERFVPDILICEIRFLGESVYPLIERGGGRMIPILVTSTCSTKSLAQQLTVNVEAYLIKPIDIDDFVDQVWKLSLLSSMDRSPTILHDGVNHPIKKLSHCGAGVR